MLFSCSLTKGKTQYSYNARFNNDYDSIVYKPETKYNLGHGYTRVPTFFKINLPKHSIRYKILEPQHVIYYKDYQLISIQIDEQNKDKSIDFLKEKPSKEQIENLILENCYSMMVDRNNINSCKYRKYRKHAIYYKNNTTIILYNIKKKNYKSYLEKVKTFEVIPQS